MLKGHDVFQKRFKNYASRLLGRPAVVAEPHWPYAVVKDKRGLFLALNGMLAATGLVSLWLQRQKHAVENAQLEVENAQLEVENSNLQQMAAQTNEQHATKEKTMQDRIHYLTGFQQDDALYKTQLYRLQQELIRQNKELAHALTQAHVQLTNLTAEFTETVTELEQEQAKITAQFEEMKISNTLAHQQTDIVRKDLEYERQNYSNDLTAWQAALRAKQTEFSNIMATTNVRHRTDLQKQRQDLIASKTDSLVVAPLQKTIHELQQAIAAKTQRIHSIQAAKNLLDDQYLELQTRFKNLQIA